MAQKAATDPFYVKTGKKKKRKAKKAGGEEGKEEAKEEEKREEKGLPVPDVSKKYRVNREMPGLPEAQA